MKTNRVRIKKESPIFFLISLVIVFILFLIIFFSTTSKENKITSNTKAAPPAIISGQPTSINIWPFVVLIFKQGTGKKLSELNAREFCTGSLIGDHWVLTAAHCVSDYSVNNKYSVAIGLSNLSNDPIDGYNKYSLEINGIYIHKDYYKDPNKNDIALLLLTPLSFPVKKYESISLINKITQYKNTDATVLGWGITDKKNPALQISNILQSAKIKVSTITSIFSRLKGSIEIDSSSFNKGKDICCGDSGGPLLSWDSNDNKWKQIGVTFKTNSNVFNICSEGYFTDVSKFTGWIKEKSGIDVNQGTFVGVKP